MSLCIFEQLVDVLHLETGALGHADLALGVEQFGAVALLLRHGADQRVEVDQRLVAARPMRPSAAWAFLRPGIMPASMPRPPIFCICCELRAQVVQVELAGGHALGELLGVFRLDRLGGASRPG